LFVNAHNLGVTVQCSSWGPHGSPVDEVEANWGFPGDAEFLKDFHEIVSERVPVNPVFRTANAGRFLP
jgi:hypothetical protein